MNWRPFDIRAFLKASKHWKEDKEKLQREMEDLSYLPSVNNETGVRSGNVSDLTAQIALRKLQIQAKIEEILLCEEMLKYAMKRLTPDERKLVEGFFYPRKQIGVFVQEYGQEHGLCREYVYGERNRVLEKMRMFIEQEYYGEG